MTNIPSLSGRRLLKVLSKFGFIVLGPGIFHKILKDCELSVSEIMEKL
jgi:predicted RNA binding protein YcfA (HicA-like mRNA interferase family)